MNNFIFGRYLPGKSIVHRINPAAKILLCFIYIFIVFFANNIATYSILAFVAMVLIILSQCSFLFFIKGIAPLIWVIIFTVIIQILFSSGGTVIFSWSIINITNVGIYYALLLFVRFILIISMSTVLTLTTSPLEIAHGIGILLMPLKRFKFPVESFSLMISIALRFIPTLTDEAKTIMDAQRSRGVDFGSGSLIKRAKAFIPLLIPLFLGAFQHADDLSLAMESRGYQTNKLRTHYYRYSWNKIDFMFIFSVIVVGVIIIFLRR
jgi:energy-coupling factor transport system permease protein